MKRINHLFNKVVDFNNLLLAAKKAFRGKKLKRIPGEFYFNLENELMLLQEELISVQFVSQCRCQPSLSLTLDVHTILKEIFESNLFLFLNIKSLFDLRK